MAIFKNKTFIRNYHEHTSGYAPATQQKGKQEKPQGGGRGGGNGGGEKLFCTWCKKPGHTEAMCRSKLAGDPPKMSKSAKRRKRNAAKLYNKGLHDGKNATDETQSETVTEAPSDNQTSTITQEVENTPEEMDPNIEKWFDEIVAGENPWNEENEDTPQ